MEGVLQKLQELGILHQTIEHPPVMTVEAQAQALGQAPGALTKNLFLKDKKGRLYIVTALADTKVDLKVLSARLGVGKGGVRLAPDELVASVLQVPLGSVTPLAACQPGASGVVLLLDDKIRGQGRVVVHPLANTASVALAPAGLEALLRAGGREALYVDLEAGRPIDRDNPPDLKPIADAAPALAKDESAAAAGPAGPAAAAATPAASRPAAAKTAKATGGKGGKGSAAAAAAPAGPRADDVDAAVEALLQQLLAVAPSAAEGLGEPGRRQLEADLGMRLNALRNAAYASGFAAARHAAVAGITGAH